MLVHPVWSDLLQCMVVHAHYGLFFTTASGKSFVGTSQLHGALTKALTECFLVDSRGFTSPVCDAGPRCVMSFAVGESQAYQECLPYLVAPQHPKALRGHCEII